METISNYISKRHIKALEKFNQELEVFRQETQEEVATLYEDPFTSFTLANVRIEGTAIKYLYDGKEDYDNCVRHDDESGETWEDDTIMENIKFWRSCIKRARRYYCMPVEKLDALQDGEVEDDEEEDEA